MPFFSFSRCLFAIAIVANVVSLTGAQLAECTIDFEPPGCPDAASECGAAFTGGLSCQTAGIGSCYDDGAYSFAVDPNAPLTILLDDDLIHVEVFFSGFNGSSGDMEFFDAIGQAVDTPLQSNGDCNTAMPARLNRRFTRPVRRIEVAALGGTVWIDRFRIIPPNCGDGVPEPGEECDDGNSTDGDGCQSDCTLTPAPMPPGDTDGDATPDSADLCPNDPSKSNPGTCGCGVPDTDSDADGLPDCIDPEPLVPGTGSSGTDPEITIPPACGAAVGTANLAAFWTTSLLGLMPLWYATRKKPR